METRDSAACKVCWNWHRYLVSEIQKFRTKTCTQRISETNAFANFGLFYRRLNVGSLWAELWASKLVEKRARRRINTGATRRSSIFSSCVTQFSQRRAHIIRLRLETNRCRPFHPWSHFIAWIRESKCRPTPCLLERSLWMHAWPPSEVAWTWMFY